MHDEDLLAKAKEVLKQNDRGNYTVPTNKLYPHQWLWDSCFIAIGLRHVDVERAKIELLSLLRGQWHNGMVPHMIFSDDPAYERDRDTWRSWTNPFAPTDVATSGITQAPMLAEAIVQVGKKLEWPERRLWYRSVWPGLLAYHQWLYRERDPHNEGLVLQVHPWETGLDNTPPWMSELHTHLLPAWIRAIEKLRLDPFITMLRRDTRSVPANERFTNVEVLALYDAQRRMRRKAYNIDKVLDHSLFIIEDLTFNAILVRANEHLRHIASSIREELPPELETCMDKGKKAFEELWDPYGSQYYSRDFITHRLLKEPSIASLMPLYAGCITQERAETIVHSLENEHMFGTSFPVPSVPLNSVWFQPKRYWQGPTWINMNWLVIDGLKRYGFHDHADALTEVCLELAHKNGMSEYFDPLTGEPLGADNFSWTAALSIDLLKK
ncbi:MAG TPA: trehalase family glycosidase [Candidatus Saccharimonadales bacterium]|nr:trehalase family glycosidase [Candidatus Saccharimonadales bacterium]